MTNSTTVLLYKCQKLRDKEKREEKIMMTMLAIILTIILVVLKTMAVISISWLLALLPILIAIGGWIIIYTVYFIRSMR